VVTRESSHQSPHASPPRKEIPGSSYSRGRWTNSPAGHVHALISKQRAELILTYRSRYQICDSCDLFSNLNFSLPERIFFLEGRRGQARGSGPPASTRVAALPATRPASGCVSRRVAGLLAGGGCTSWSADDGVERQWLRCRGASMRPGLYDLGRIRFTSLGHGQRPC
jgi:hypothetical protein